MDADVVIERINALLVEEFELDPDEVRPEANLRDDLELDSLDAIDLVVAIEKEFGLRMDEKQLAFMKTVGDVHAHIRVLAAA